MTVSANSQRAELRVADRIGHRQEELGLDALEREQRQIGGDDDQRREEDRLRDLQRGLARVGFVERLVRLCLAAAQNGLRHDDRGVDDDAEVDGAERQQVGRESS